MNTARLLRRTRSLVVALTACGAVAASTLHTLWSLLGGAYTADDIWNSQLPAQLAASGQGFWSSVVTNTRVWMHGAGRFFPTSIAEGSAAFTLFQTRFAYKAFLVAIVCIDVALFYVFAARLTRQRWFGCVAAALVAIELQFRFFYDGIQEFGGQQETMLALVLVAAICTLNYLDRQRTIWLVAALVSWALALTTYETSYLLLPVVWIAVWHRRRQRRDTLLALGATMLPTLALGAYVMYLRFHLVSTTTPQYTISLTPVKVLPALGKQLVGTTPFAEYYFRHARDLAGFLHAPHFSVFTAVLLVLVATTIVFALMRQSISKRDIAATIAAGLVLVIGPALTVSIAEFWQGYLVWGDAYISVYAQGFGLTLVVSGMLAAGVRFLRSTRLGGRSAMAFAVVCAILASYGTLGIAQNNVRVITVRDPGVGWMNQQPFLGWSRQVFTDAATSGLFDLVPRGTKIAVMNGAPWINSDFLSYQAKRTLSVVNAYPPWALTPTPPTQVPGCPLAASTCHASSSYDVLLQEDATSYTAGYVLLGTYGSLRSRLAGPGALVGVMRGPKLYIESPMLARIRTTRLCRLISKHRPHVYRSFRTIASGTTWRILETSASYRFSTASVGIMSHRACVPL